MNKPCQECDLIDVVQTMTVEIAALRPEVARLRDGIAEHAAWGHKVLPAGANPAPHDYRLWRLLDGDR